ncbi:PH domain-containing protein [Sphingomonas piscis]|uniref:PH domain-containing protein n=1 Tax=Sphingomonas piscis TaxID=2714943 RepID=A0A6G7YS93_9SPHN|nr:PH domain-containing protein [Sphingomonas piscis]QIK79613.1 PH domain-containing protein [Sphingomonas piscis]
MGFFAATEVDVSDIDKKYGALLLDDERILAAFKTIRDVVFLTGDRLCLINIQGLTGKKVEVTSIPYRSIVRYSIETAGTFDLDADLKIWISSTHEPLEIKIGRGSDLPGIQKLLAKGVLRR